jgi:hypothetical protein
MSGMREMHCEICGEVVCKYSSTHVSSSFLPSQSPFSSAPPQVPPPPRNHLAIVLNTHLLASFHTVFSSAPPCRSRENRLTYTIFVLPYFPKHPPSIPHEFPIFIHMSSTYHPHIISLNPYRVLLRAALQIAREQVELHLGHVAETRVLFVVRVHKVLNLRHLELAAVARRVVMTMGTMKMTTMMKNTVHW